MDLFYDAQICFPSARDLDFDNADASESLTRFQYSGESRTSEDCLEVLDHELEAFLQRLEADGILCQLRSQGRMYALRRRESQDSLGTMMESSSGGGSSELDDTSVSGSVSTTDTMDMADQEFSGRGGGSRRRWLRLGSRRSYGNFQQDSRWIDSEEGEAVTDEDLYGFQDGLEEGESGWVADGFKLTFDRVGEKFSAQAWARDDLKSSATEYRSRIVIEDLDAETARDFFLDDSFRAEWDENRVSSRTLEEWNEAGCQVAQWVRRFPLFLRDREYVVARRIWSLEERSFHCISKCTKHPSAPKRCTPWRVDRFNDSWHIMPVKGRGGGLTACAIVNFHFEESGISRNLAKMAVSHGFYPYVVKMEEAMKTYHTSGRNYKHALPVFILRVDADIQKRQEGGGGEESLNQSDDQCQKEISTGDKLEKG